MSLRLHISFPDLVADCCPDRIYAMVFNEDSSKALKDNGSGVLVLTPYLESTHATFALVLTEHAQRTKYYSRAIANANLILAATPYGEKYSVEYWRRPDVGTFQRDQDILAETRPLYWDGLEEAASRLSQGQERKLNTYEVHVVIGYNSTTQTIYGVAWLELNHLLVQDTTQATFLWRDYNGTILSNITTPAILTDTPGVFRFSQPATDLAPDRLGVITATIRDAAAIDHVGVSGTNTWD